LIKSLITYHLNNKGQIVTFSSNEESDGTLRLLELLPILYYILSEQTIIIIDEIEHSIHPNLLKQLITKFSENKETKGQLIFTTHETHLLDQEIFRQDEIWMAEKNSNGATELYPMSDFNVRYDLDIRKGYLNGRFGGIPFLHNFKDLTVKPHATN
jgi:AAA15 family ATPase/GTPase